MTPRFPRSVSLHPFAPQDTGVVRALDVHLREPVPGTLALRYVLEGDLSRLRTPPAREPRHTDELWRHTCFEMFARRTADGPAYLELNASPSTEWALYTFDDYHTGMAPARPARHPRIRVTRTAHRLEMEVRADLRDLPHAGPIALTAVIEDDRGRLGYWALKHPSPRPDFHHPDGFLIGP
ncbi:DOMON-like domain-containing protein [Streptomyces sp. SBT349]|uniref:DOMON-like domain-containing protein n=1 Tax=Streptomyces sp. SBT349 TaxID=1580539 RepID=UPI00099BCD38|nr:DOMON-like domain-containing protein [Streptomyces sp. SBT349]